MQPGSASPSLPLNGLLVECNKLPRIQSQYLCTEGQAAVMKLGLDIIAGEILSMPKCHFRELDSFLQSSEKERDRASDVIMRECGNLISCL
jgi:hypothetical protein